MPLLNNEEIDDRVKTINRFLDKKQFSKAQFLMNDLIFSLKTAVEKLDNWIVLERKRNIEKDYIGVDNV